MNKPRTRPGVPCVGAGFPKSWGGRTRGVLSSLTRQVDSRCQRRSGARTPERAVDRKRSARRPWPVSARIGPVAKRSGKGKGSELTAADVVRDFLGRGVGNLLRYDPIVRRRRDPEGIHQMRVECRTPSLGVARRPTGVARGRVPGARARTQVAGGLAGSAARPRRPVRPVRVGRVGGRHGPPAGHVATRLPTRRGSRARGPRASLLQVPAAHGAALRRGRGPAAAPGRRLPGVEGPRPGSPRGRGRLHRLRLGPRDESEPRRPTPTPDQGEACRYNCELAETFLVDARPRPTRSRGCRPPSVTFTTTTWRAPTSRAHRATESSAAPRSTTRSRRRRVARRRDRTARALVARTRRGCDRGFGPGRRALHMNSSDAPDVPVK